MANRDVAAEVRAGSEMREISHRAIMIYGSCRVQNHVGTDAGIGLDHRARKHNGAGAKAGR